MAHRVTVDFYKFCLISFLIFNNGFPIKGVPEAQTDGSKAPSVKECRAHIEAALEQYWETSEVDKKDREPAQDSTPLSTTSQSDDSLAGETEGPQSEDETDQDDDDTDPPVDVHFPDETQDGEDENEDEDDDEDEDEEEDEDEDEGAIASKDDADEGGQTPDNDLDEDEDEEEDEEDDEEDEEVETADAEASPGDEPDDEDDEEDEDQEEKEGALKEAKDEDEEETDVTDKPRDEASHQEGSKDDEKDDVNGEQEAESEDEEEEEEGEEEENGEDEEEEEETEEAMQEVEAKEEIEEQEEEEEEEEEVKEVPEDEEEEEEEAGEEVGDEVEEKEQAKEEVEEEEEKEEVEEEEEEEEEVEEKEEVEEEEKEEVEEEEAEDTEKEKSTEDSLESDERGDKVTGETHSAPAGMAPELSETKPASDQPKAPPVEEKATLESKETEEDEEKEDEGEEETDEDEDEDDLIENIYEEEDEEDHLVVKPGESLRSRDHVDAILELDDIGTDYDLEEEKLAQSVFKEIKKIHSTSIKPMEMLYKYADSTTRILGDAEIFSKPMILFLGPWSAGKTTVINYLLGLERTPAALKTGTGITDLDFTVINYGDQRRITSGTALAADWTYAGVQKFGQGLLDHFKGITIPHTLLKKVTLVDTPGIIESKKNDERGYPFNDAFQWFIDRADAIYVVLDPTKVDIGAELGSVLDQLKGREVRFILNKADTIRRSDLMRVVGQLFWNLSPLMSSTEAPVIYAVSLTTKPFHPSAPAKFLADQENNFLYDLQETIEKHVENRIRYARRHAVRVRNHCKMVDCYLSTYYRHKSIFSSKKNVAKLITENPAEYNIYDGLSSMTNVSRYDLPDPVAYTSFFRMHPLYDFKPLVSTCSYFRGCPMDKLDIAISKELPELLAKYKKAKLDIPSPVKQEGR